jgi:hypothetical protein
MFEVPDPILGCLLQSLRCVYIYYLRACHAAAAVLLQLQKLAGRLWNVHCVATQYHRNFSSPLQALGSCSGARSLLAGALVPL